MTLEKWPDREEEIWVRVSSSVIAKSGDKEQVLNRTKGTRDSAG